MRLYKYRSLRRDLDFTLDIILHERLYCADYKSLNDPLEGFFKEEIHPAFGRIPGLGTLGPAVSAGQVEDLPDFRRENRRICSLSKPLENMVLWSHYGDAHKGVAIEIDFPDQSPVREVTYVKDLRTFPTNLLTGASSEDILAFKTAQWAHEGEYRIIQSEEYYSAADCISAVYLGARISETHLGILARCVPAKIPIFRTRIDWYSAKVEPAGLLDRSA